jgi:hypothetical protein
MTLGAICNTGFALILLWILYYFGWRPYRIDKLRNDLFEIRNELFLYAASGEVSFDNAAYRVLCDRINAMIRFAHMLTLTRGMLFAVMQSKHPLPKSKQNAELWVLGLKEASGSTQKKLTDISNRVAGRCASQLLIGAPPLLVIAMIYVSILAMGKLLHFNDEDSVLRVAKELKVELIEEQAVLAQQQERAAQDESCLMHA